MPIRFGAFMKIYLTNIKNISLDRVCELNPERAEKTARLKIENDKKRCIAGGLLLNRFVSGVISKNEYGKPVSDSGIEFNLSHSGEYVLLAISEYAVGCDIEKVKFVKAERLGEIVFCENEMNKISESQDKQKAFFELWTKKESLLKCMGKGFHRSAKSVDVSGDTYTEDGIKYYFKTWYFSDYIISVCSEKNDFPKNPEFIEL